MESLVLNKEDNYVEMEPNIDLAHGCIEAILEIS
jgi:hypothetical protein